MAKIKQCKSDLKIMRMNWTLLEWCNYKCSYCNTITTNDFSVPAYSTNYKLVIARLKTITEPFELCLAGGEPTLHPNIEEILTELAKVKQLQRVWFFTNLSRTKEFLTNLINIDHDKICLYASYHPEYYTEKFLEKCKALRCDINVSLIDDPTYWPTTIEFLEACKEHQLEYKINLLEETDNWKPNFTEEFKQTFSKYISGAEDVLNLTLTYEDGKVEQSTDLFLELNNLDNFNGYLCTPASFHIQMDGTVRNICSGDAMPMSLSSNNIVRQISCPKNRCTKGLLMYPKEKNAKL